MRRTTAALEGLAVGLLASGVLVSFTGLCLFCWAVSIWMRAHLPAQTELAEFWMPRAAVVFFVGFFLFGPAYLTAKLSDLTRPTRPRA